MGIVSLSLPDRWRPVRACLSPIRLRSALGHKQPSRRPRPCPLCPRKRTLLGALACPLSAITGREQMQQTTCVNALLFDHLVGASEQRGRPVRPSVFLVAPSWRAKVALKGLTLDHLTNDRLHVCLCKRSQGLRANISKGATTASKRGHGNVIWCLNNRDHVILAQCPESIPHVPSALLRHFFEGVCPFW